LVDKLGGFQAAINEAAGLAKLSKDGYRVNYVERMVTPFEQAILDMSNNAYGAKVISHFAPASSLLGRETTEKIQKDLQWLDAKNRIPYQGIVHCMCSF
jgi:protease IV